MSRVLRIVVAGAVTAISLVLAVLQLPVAAPDTAPVARWRFDKDSVKDTKVPDAVGKRVAEVTGIPTFASGGIGLEVAGLERGILVGDVKPGDPLLPKEAFTITAWVRIDRGTKWGGIVACLQDNGAKEKGFVLGYNEKQFLFGLATTGADDGDGKLTYLSGKTDYEPGKWYFVASTYDGKKMALHVNAQADGESAEQSGPVLPAAVAPFVIGAYRDEDEHHPLHGAIRDVAIYHRALSPDDLAAAFRPDAKLAEQPPMSPAPQFVVAPYLQFATQTSMTVMWETSVAGPSVVEYGLEGNLTEKATGPAATLHEIKLENLKPATNYTYRVTTTPAQGEPVVSPVATFQTGVGPDDAYSFIMLGDTQRNPVITGKVAQKAWLRRPNFALHLGDVVDNGPDNKQWVEDLFRPCRDLFGRVAVFPCIGNHERNHPNYYKYFSLPAPEYHYRFTYGNADFFVLDTNKKITPESDQFKWLDAELAKSTATWKFCFHHHPARSSDEDDYGNTWKGKPSTMGSASPMALITLFDKHSVDAVFNGHVHAYERTWPLRDGKIDREKGTVYITSGGGGGKLEGFSPTPTWFKAMVRSDFHYCYIAIHGKKFSLKAFDHDDRLFDFLDIEKR